MSEIVDCTKNLFYVWIHSSRILLLYFLTSYLWEMPFLKWPPECMSISVAFSVLSVVVRFSPFPTRLSLEAWVVCSVLHSAQCLMLNIYISLNNDLENLWMKKLIHRLSYISRLLINGKMKIWILNRARKLSDMLDTRSFLEVTLVTTYGTSLLSVA